MEQEIEELGKSVDKAWMRFMAYLMMRLSRGDYYRSIMIDYSDGVDDDETPDWIALSRRGSTYIALGSAWLDPEVIVRIAQLPSFRSEHGRLVATDDNPGRLAHSTCRAFREILAVPHPAFLTLEGISPAKERLFRSPYVERNRPPF